MLGYIVYTLYIGWRLNIHGVNVLLVKDMLGWARIIEERRKEGFIFFTNSKFIHSIFTDQIYIYSAKLSVSRVVCIP